MIPFKPEPLNFDSRRFEGYFPTDNMKCERRKPCSTNAALLDLELWLHLGEGQEDAKKATLQLQ